MHFSLRSLFVLIAVVSLYLGLRRVLFVNYDISEIVYFVPPLTALLAVLIGMSCLSITRTFSLTVVGSFASLVVATDLFVTIAEAARRTDSNYWNWRHGWPIFALTIGFYAGVGAGLGAGVAEVLHASKTGRES